MFDSKTILDRPPLGDWFVLGVSRCEPRKWDWCVLMIDVHPDELKHCRCEFAWLYVHPKDYRPGNRRAYEVYVRIPGKHRNYDAACAALNAMMATRH